MNKTTLLILFIFGMIANLGFGQIINRSGYIYSEISGKLATMPSDSGNHYVEPTNSQLTTWENTLVNLLHGNYSIASDSANSIGYNLVNFTDTFTSTDVTYYILETIDSNYWGTYVYNPNYCRPLVIQSPHAKKDANTGLQGIHLFRKTEAMFYEVNGTHRCNSSVYSSCTGTTTGCSSTSTSEPYPISDLAHNTQSLFQKTTEVLFKSFGNTYFIQFHGFTKLSTDPYVVLSSGAQNVPTPDYHSIFKTHLYNQDTVLTFKISHIDLSWTRLRGFWNTQGRLINGSPNPCTVDPTVGSGRFFHIEQERVRLRSNVTAWNKTVNALNNTFPCSYTSVDEDYITKTIKVYPNPTNDIITIECDEIGFDLNSISIFNTLGQEMNKQVSIDKTSVNQLEIDLGKLPAGLYFVRINNETINVYKN